MFTLGVTFTPGCGQKMEALGPENRELSFNPKLINAETGVTSKAPAIDFYAGIGEGCCGNDAHPVHGIQTNDGGFVLVGKSIDKSKHWEGFIVKIGPSKLKGSVLLDKDEDNNFQWSNTFGSEGVKDGANNVANKGNFVIVGGFVTASDGTLDRYIGKYNLKTGKTIWEKTYPDPKSKTDGAIESLQVISDGGLIATGFVNGAMGKVEGFKSYGNPQDGEAFLMYFSSTQLASNDAPETPVWTKVYSESLTGKSVREVSDEDGGLILATASRKNVAMLTRTDTNGEVTWTKKYPVHGEITDIAVTTHNKSVTGFAMVGNHMSTEDGIDGAITKVAKDGSFLWKKTYGNPLEVFINLQDWVSVIQS